ncbi:MAG: AIR synthase-related protein [Eubacteriales bacterium]|nr:AIR synthase-related protein [Eubacteriales bacterium]
MSSEEYLKRGVSANKSEVKAAVASQDKGLFPGAFAKVSKDPAGDPDYCFLFHADGAGTKSSVAYLQYCESGDPTVFRGIAQDSFVMNSDDLLAVGACGPFYLSNTIGRNAQRIPGEVIAELISAYADFAAKLGEYGIEVELTGGETADVGDLVQTIICDSTLGARMRRDEVIDASNIGPGQLIVGLSSTGQSSYEDRENSGIASNGLTAARHFILSPHYREKYPESFASSLDPSLAYVGKYRLSDPLPGSSLSIGQALLSPTRSYLPVFKNFLKEWRSEVKGIIHNTGGALTKSLNFGQSGTRFVKEELFERPAIFKAIAEQGAISEKEMYEVFNLGQLMEVYCSEAAAEALINEAAKFKIEAKIIGYTEKIKSKRSAEKELIIRDCGKDYSYAN